MIYNLFYIFLIIFVLFIYMCVLVISYVPIHVIGYFTKVSDKKLKQFNIEPIKYLTLSLIKPYPLLKLSFFEHNSYTMSYIETNIYNPLNMSLIFIHGTFSSSIVWLDTINKLLIINPNINIFAIDLMGAGLSSNINLSYLEFIDLNILIIHELILSKNLIDPIIISSSFGGLINLEYNLRYPLRSVIFNPPAIFHLINKYQYYITLMGRYKIIKNSLNLFSPEIIYKLGIKFKLDLELIYWLCALRTNTLTENILKGTNLNILNGYSVRSIIQHIINRNDIKSKCKIIFSLNDNIVGTYAGELLETYGFDVKYLEYTHFISLYEKIAEYILDCVSEPVKWKDMDNLIYSNNRKYFFYPSPNLSNNQIDLMVADIKYFS